MTGQRLYKAEKLCSQRAIDTLFTKGESRSVTAYPLRVVWRVSQRSDGAPSQFLISVPKKRIRHAVDRVTLRRRIRESYRLNRSCLSLPDDCRVDMAFIYLDAAIHPYSHIEMSVVKAMQRISSTLRPAVPDTP
ncbi:MAG: ribonuclease P protein component [Pseudoflavonifractor sp.]|nr:ribonuclease P protein component [Pseudoflavonifractor sp.]